MTPKAGEVYMLDLGYEGKVRPVVIMSREDANAPRALSLFVPLTKESRGSRYEVTMPRPRRPASKSHSTAATGAVRAGPGAVASLAPGADLRSPAPAARALWPLPWAPA